MALGVGLRILLVLTGSGTARFTFADSDSYLIVADALPRALWSPDAAVVTSTLWRTPVYPAFLWATGGSSHLTLVALVQCLVGGALNVWLVHRLGRLLLGPTAALVAAVICAVDPAALGQTLLIATETLTTTWLLLLLLATATLLRRADAGQPLLLAAAAAGGAGALLALTRPNLLLLIPATAALVALAGRRRPSVVAAATLLAVGLVPVGAWIARNDHVAGSPVLSTVAGQNLVDFGFAATAHDQGRIGFWTTDAQRVSRAVASLPETRGLTTPVDGDTASVATDRAWRGEGWAALRSHPRGALTVVIATSTKTALAPGTGLLSPHLPDRAQRWLADPLRVAGAAFIVAVDLAALAGVVDLVRRRRWRDLWLLVGTLAIYLASSMGPWFSVRFRVPILPIVALLAGAGVAWARGRPRVPA